MENQENKELKGAQKLLFNLRTSEHKYKKRELLELARVLEQENIEFGDDPEAQQEDREIKLEEIREALTKLEHIVIDDLINDEDYDSDCESRDAKARLMVFLEDALENNPPNRTMSSGIIGQQGQKGSFSEARNRSRSMPFGPVAEEESS
eukprot:GHVP01019906.1.p1 GENE.GHVP01019906.1~~GHVP01019906.1.p1  ORF type:complete len:150 (-),score=37.79 GHVP01019906.1:145-594(-)